MKTTYTSTVNINDYKQEKECVYKNDRYSVRDNGAVLRHPRKNKRPRPIDNQWTFGKPNKGYMEIASVRIHRIIATAFHGEPPSKEHIVDHIDTNRQNNRSENLRWVTRLENVLNNPITRKRIILACGSIEAFLADPSLLRENDVDRDFRWMRTVTATEAQVSKERLLAWAKSDKQPSGGTFGEWVYGQPVMQNRPTEIIQEESDIIMSLTPRTAQRDWRTPSEFPCTPQEIGDNPLAAYADNLKERAIFCRNHIYSSLVFKSAFSEDHQSLYVMTESSEEDDAVKPYALAKVTYEDGLFVHTSICTFFSKEGAEKQFALAQGLEYTGGNTFDDYC